MDASEIKDRETLQGWLETRPQSDSVTIAHRAALHVTPMFYRSFGLQGGQEFGSASLTVLCCDLTSGVAHKWLTPEIIAAAVEAKAATRRVDFALTFHTGYALAAIDAAQAAAATAAAARVDAVRSYAVRAAAAHAADAAAAAYSAVHAAYTRDNAAANATAIWHSLRADATALQSGIDPLTFPLWPGTPPDWFTPAEAQMRAYWNANPTLWSFWQRWWDAASTGRPLDWTLQRDIALIDDAIWRAGPEAGIQDRRNRNGPSPPPYLQWRAHRAGSRNRPVHPCPRN